MENWKLLSNLTGNKKRYPWKEWGPSKGTSIKKDTREKSEDPPKARVLKKYYYIKGVTIPNPLVK